MAWSATTFLFLVLLNTIVAFYPPVARGPQWSKSRPGGPVVKFAPTVTVTLGDTLPTIHACLGDRVVICNISKNRVYILGSDDMPNEFHSGIIQPVSSAAPFATKVKFAYIWYAYGKAGNYTYYDVRSKESASFIIVPSAAHNASFFDRP